jgi:hypothetical protein
MFNNIQHQQDDTQAAFEAAIASGRLSRNCAAINYVNDYMYMGRLHGRAMFKNVNTRAYLPWTVKADGSISND